MISKLNNIKPLKYFWILMALFLLNCSVDTTGLFVNSSSNRHLIVNDQESIIEILVEQFLGFDNLITETADDDVNQTANLKKANVIDIFILPDFSFTAQVIVIGNKNFETLEGSNIFNSIHFKIPSPPPEV